MTSRLQSPEPDFTLNCWFKDDVRWLLKKVFKWLGMTFYFQDKTKVTKHIRVDFTENVGRHVREAVSTYRKRTGSRAKAVLMSYQTARKLGVECYFDYPKNMEIPIGQFEFPSSYMGTKVVIMPEFEEGIHVIGEKELR